MNEIIKNLIGKALKGPLSESEATSAFSIIMEGQASEAQIGGFLIALRSRGESVEEYSAAAKVMRSRCIKVKAPKNAIDIVGTGGDGKGTLNISTAAAIVVASAGVPVAKHGNRNLSSKSGAADLLSQCGIEIMGNAKTVEACLKTANIGFMMAPNYHPAVKHVMPARQALGTRTIFNILGPLTNPAYVKFQLTGAFEKKLLKPMAKILESLGTKKAWLVHGEDGTDEISITGNTYVVELSKSKFKEFTICPSDAGLPLHPFEAILGGTPKENASAFRDLLDGKLNAYRDSVLFNAGAALLVAGRVASLKEGTLLAAKSIDNGYASQTLVKLVQTSQGG